MGFPLDLEERSNSAVPELGLEDLERKPKRCHQFAAVITNRSIDLDAETIAKFGVLLQIVLNRRIGDVSGKCFVICINL